MDRQERLSLTWYIARPVLIYIVLLSVVQGILYRLLESFLLFKQTDMVLYYAYWGAYFAAVIAGIAHTAAVIPLLREARREVSLWERRDCWMAHRRDQNTLMLMLLPGVLCTALSFNLFTQRFAAEQAADLSGWRLTVCVLIYGLVTPFTEELVFRGMLFGRLRRHLSFLEAGILSAAVFGAYHGNLRQGLYGLLMGFLFAAAYELTGRFAVPYLLHAVTNAVVLTAASAGLLGNGNGSLWGVFLLSGALCVTGYYAVRLRRTGWDPRKRPGSGRR
ncbi:MAG: CPBP family intramembrane metalloprotease [Lachnospiraceae bacterium]|nr:CPBP family intramembrane metalloprotease [Lachnospiraceae bacterium]